LNYIVPLYLGNELLAFGMNGPNSGWVNKTGADFNRNPAPTVPEVNPSYRTDNQGHWVIDDPDDVVIRTKGYYIRGFNYGPSPFYRHAYALLSEKRVGSEIPAGLNEPQKSWLQMFSVHYFKDIEGRGEFNPDRHSYNTQAFRTYLKNYDGRPD
jgi:hypothetical protein